MNIQTNNQGVHMKRFALCVSLCAIAALPLIAVPAIANADSQAPATTIKSAHPAAPTVQVAGDKLFGDVTDDLSGVASV